MRVRFKKIPTYNADDGTWSETTFSSQLAFHDFLRSIFKEPGEYGFDESTLMWNRLGNRYMEKKNYTNLIKRVAEWNDFWNFEKKKCRYGVIWKSKGNVWYTSQEYYMLLNFLPIINKEKGSTETFPDVRDTQYHLQLYEKLGDTFHKDQALIKKRQMLSSYYHVAKLICVYWFEPLKRLKILASDDSYIKGVTGSWTILEHYRDFLNANTPWYRHSNPGEVGSWEQKIKIKVGSRWTYKGKKSTIVAQTLNKDPKKGVGGPTWYAFYEEGGIAPTADTTKSYMDPAMDSGMERTGSFVIAGSVGDLNQCEPLRKMITYPDAYNIYKVPCRNVDDTGVIKDYGLFIPAQYGMPPFIDEYGNSLVKEATEALKKMQEEWKELAPDQYRLKMSQNPMTLKQAFDYREEGYFPATLIERRQQIIEEQRKEGKIKPLRGIMKEDDKGNPIFVPLDKLPHDEQPPEMGYPVNPRDKDKRGLTLVYEPPSKKPGETPEFGINFAGVDTVEANITFTSESLFCVVIVSRIIEVHTEDEQGNRSVRYEGGKLKAIYAGRYNDINDTNKQGELLVRWYNALAAVERNKPNFINHMRKHYAKLLAKRRDMPLFKEIDATGYDTDEYGIYMGSDDKASDIINQNVLEDLTTSIDAIHKKNKDGSLGEVVKTIRGLDLIDDYWTLEELKLYHKGLNTDRRVAFGLAKTLAKCFELSYKKKTFESKAPKKELPRQEGFSLLSGRPPKRTRSLLG